jgi:hypothetical protein
MVFGQMKPSPEDAFDCWVRVLGFRGRDTLADLPESLRGQLQRLQEMYNEAFRREKYVPEHVRTLPLYFDYLDADEENAIATHDGEHYAFIGVTRRLVLKISDICIRLSQSDGAICGFLRVQPSTIPYNELQAALFYTLLSFVVAHEWAHHKHGHLTQLSSRDKIFHEISDSGLVGSVDDQIKEIAADGYAALHMLSNLFDDGRTNFLPFLTFDYSPTPEFLDRAFLAFFVVAIGGYTFLRPARDLNRADVYRVTHPPAPARLTLVMEEAVAWCSHNRPALEDWLRQNFQRLMDATVETVTDNRPVWANQLIFLKSGDGEQYMATLRNGIAAYRKSWGAETETAEIIEAPREILLELTPAGRADTEFPKAVADFSKGLRGADVAFSTRRMAFDSATSTGLTGVLIVLATTLGSRAIIELRKLLQSYLAHGGRKIKLKNGPVTIEASASDFLRIFTPEQIQKLIEPPPKKAASATKR